MTTESELEGGIKNALEKGIPLEKIIQTFLNAGYPQHAVQAAAQAVSEGASTIAVPPQPTQPSISVQPSVLAPAVQEKTQSQNIITPEGNEGISRTKIYFLVGILIMLLILLGASLLFREEFVALIS